MAKNFLDIKEKIQNEAQVVIVPFGFEATTTYGGGTDKGPEAIIKASAQVELFDEELWQETYKKVGINTLKEPKNLKVLEKAVGETIKNKKLPIVLGGEHSITPFIISAYKKSGFDNFSILQFDAHADLRDGYLGKKYSHAAAMRRCLDFDGINLVQVGIRNISNENDELVFWEKNQNRIKTFWAKDEATWKINEIVGALKENVYISFDVDAFDCSLMPSTGTPEPGGLGWYEAIDILRAVCQNKKIIGADFVELAPIKGLHAPDFLVAKLIYKTIGYIFNRVNK
ncbi:MAG TPA: agmatinase [Candidatus Portnoybacteria bacterium]|nr:agmatinase [Candidatus Portnoybacteria bacterium]